MSKKGHSEPNIMGGYTHYDSKGHKVGRSEPNIFGGFNEYDAKGHKIGHSERTALGDYNHYDKKGHKVGRSYANGTFGYTHYDSKGHKVGRSDPKVLGGYSHNDSSSSGCYIATCVYGSYDCPEVWTLRRFRDYRLMETVPGRAFVKFYYRVSPTVVRLFGDSQVFRGVWRWFLDKWVVKLKWQGYADSPYDDRII